MSVTRLTDIIYGPLFLPTTLQRTTELSTIRNSGIVSQDAQIQAFANAPGDVVTLPFWSDISGESNVSSDDPSQHATPNKIGMSQDQGRKIRRNNGWSSANLVGSVLTEDPLDTIATLIAGYWDREEQKILVHEMNGVFASASMAGNTLPVASEDPAGSGGPINLDAEVAANAYALLGDAGGSLTGMMIHSRVYWNLHAARAIFYVKDPVTGLSFNTWDGKNIIINDACPRVAGSTSGYKYTSYLFGNGAFAYAQATGAGGPEEPVELDKDASGGNGEGVRTLWYRRHWIMHPRGVAFVGTVAGNSPTNTELATGTKWSRAYDPKNVRMVALTTNG